MEEEGVVNAVAFYTQYYGHPLEYLARLVRYFRSLGRRIVWLVGDSSLDNKHWLFEEDKTKTTLDLDHGWCAQAVNGYENVLRPPRMVRDVCYWMNYSLRGTDWVCINTAVEESCLVDAPSAHDGFVLSHLQSGDMVVASIGGNDLILKPSTSVLVTMGVGTYLIPQWCLGTALTWLPNPLYELFATQTQEYLNLFNKVYRKVICTPYFPCASGGGWANRVLRHIDMIKAQTVIRAIHELYHKSLQQQDDGTIAVPLYEALDWHCEGDYKCRVEPSVDGGRKIAQEIIKKACLLSFE